MARAKKNQTPAPTEPVAGTTEQAKPWTTKSHSDGDLRIPSEIRQAVKIGAHESFVVEIVENSSVGFTLRFTR